MTKTRATLGIALLAIASTLLVLAVAVVPPALAQATVPPLAGTAALVAVDGAQEEAADVNYSAAFGAAAANARAADLAAAKQTASWVQQLTVVNLDGTESLCVDVTTWAATCAALAPTCRGGGNPGQIVAPLATRRFSFVGTLRPCIVATGAATEAQVETVDVRGR